MLNQDLALEMVKAQYEEVRHHKDVRDRWFQFYLMIVGGPLAALSAYFTSSTGQAQVAGALPILLASSGFFAFAGVIFMLLYTRQRINVLAVYIKIRALQGQLITDHLGASSPTAQALLRHPTRRQYSADYLSLSLYVVLNAIWAAIAGICAARLFGLTNTTSVYSGAILFVVTVGCLVVVCRIALQASESAFYERPLEERNAISGAEPPAAEKRGSVDADAEGVHAASISLDPLHAPRSPGSSDSTSGRGTSG